MRRCCNPDDSKRDYTILLLLLLGGGAAAWYLTRRPRQDAAPARLPAGQADAGQTGASSLRDAQQQQQGGAITQFQVPFGPTSGSSPVSSPATLSAARFAVSAYSPRPSTPFIPPR